MILLSARNVIKNSKEKSQMNWNQKTLIFCFWKSISIKSSQNVENEKLQVDSRNFFMKVEEFLLSLRKFNKDFCGIKVI